MITRAAHFYCKPALEPKFEEVYLSKTVLVAEINKSEMKPHYALGEDKKWWVYIRVKDKSVLASKIVIDVLKSENSEHGVLLEYSSKEKALLEYLNEHERITSREYSQMLNLSKTKNTPVTNLVLSGVIRLHTTEKKSTILLLNIK